MVGATMKSLFTTLMVTSILVATWIAAFDIQLVAASDTIYIRADGRVDPATAPIERHGDIYIITDNVNGSVVVQRSDITIDGGAFSLVGTEDPWVEDKGIRLDGLNNVTIRNTRLREFAIGIYIFNSSKTMVYRNIIENGRQAIRLTDSSNSLIAENNMTSNSFIGIGLLRSFKNVIFGNQVTNSGESGIRLDWSYNNTVAENRVVNGNRVGICLPFASTSNNLIAGNSIINNGQGVGLSGSPTNNTFVHNNFIGNTQQVVLFSYPARNNWDNGFEGNYWSDYEGADVNRDGLGDSAYEIDPYYMDKDRFPLRGMYSSFNTSFAQHVDVISNSTIEDFQYFEANATIRMHVANRTANQTHGFIRMSIPHTLMAGTYNVTIDGASPAYWNYTLYDNGTHRWLYFAYEHSQLEIVITPEFPLTTLPLFMLATLLAVMLWKRTTSGATDHNRDAQQPWEGVGPRQTECSGGS
jgi:parallel beta-helix repeat protein